MYVGAVSFTNNDINSSNKNQIYKNILTLQSIFERDYPILNIFF